MLGFYLELYRGVPYHDVTSIAELRGKLEYKDQAAESSEGVWPQSWARGARVSSTITPKTRNPTCSIGRGQLRSLRLLLSVRL